MKMDKMAHSRRVATWEISESEGEDDSDIKASSTSNVNTPKINEPNLETEANNNQTETRTALVHCGETRNDTDSPPSLTAPSTPSPKKRRRRTKEEIDADKLDLERRRKDREKHRNEKAAEKKRKRREQQMRKQDAERIKCYRPENCLKSLTVCIDPALLQDERSDILLGCLHSMERRTAIEEQQLRNSITWTRDLPQGEDKPSPIEEDQALMVLTLNDFLDVVVSIKLAEQTDTEEVAVDSLFKQLSEYLNRRGEKIVTLMVIGPKPSNRTKCSRLYGDQMLQSQMGEEGINIEEALVFLQLYRNTSVIFLDSWQGLTDHVCAITKALSKRPFKQLTEKDRLPFCLDGSWASGVRVERDGTGLSGVWCRQVQQLNRVSPAVAAGLCAAFPSPQLLLQAYKTLGSESERKALLADLSAKIGERERRVGPDISSRLYRFFTAENPQLVLD